MDAGISNYLLTQGVLGVMVLIESYIIIKFYNKIEQLEKEKYAIGESRRIDDKATLKEVTSVLQENSQSNYVLAAKIETGKSIERNQR